VTETETIENEAEETGVALGPLFTAGALLVVAGIVRRRKLALAAGLAAIWADQRTHFGRDLKERVKQRVKAQAKARSTS
jgi:hypothetical protein